MTKLSLFCPAAHSPQVPGQEERSHPPGLPCLKTRGFLFSQALPSPRVTESEQVLAAGVSSSPT
jgi:hypothetical protein